MVGLSARRDRQHRDELRVRGDGDERLRSKPLADRDRHQPRHRKELRHALRCPRGKDHLYRRGWRDGCFPLAIIDEHNRWVRAIDIRAYAGRGRQSEGGPRRLPTGAGWHHAPDS